MEKKQSGAQKLAQAVIGSGIDSPQINEFVMNALFEELMGGQGDTDKTIREAIAGRLMESEEPDFLKIRDILAGADLDELFKQQEPMSLGQQEGVQSQMERGDLELADKLAQLSSGQYSQYEKFQPEGPTFLERLFGNVTSPKQEDVSKNALVSLLGPLPTMFGQAALAGHEGYQSAEEQKKNLIDRLLSEKSVAGATTLTP